MNMLMDMDMDGHEQGQGRDTVNGSDRDSNSDRDTDTDRDSDETDKGSNTDPLNIWPRRTTFEFGYLCEFGKNLGYDPGPYGVVS